MQYVEQKIYEAEALYLKDKIKADKIWRDISQLYKNNPRYSAYVKRSVDRLSNQPVDPLPPREESAQHVGRDS
jgi:hypothetical protein